jgi:ATP-binding cassette, subfamily B, bacterial PglK
MIDGDRTMLSPAAPANCETDPAPVAQSFAALSHFMLDNFRKLYVLLTGAEKFSFVVLLAMMLTEALLEMIGVAIIPLFITSLAYPEHLANNPTVINLLGDGRSSWLERDVVVVWGSLFLGTFFAGKACYSIVVTYWKSRFSQNRALKLSVRLFRAYLRAPYDYHLRHNSSDLFRNIHTECAHLALHTLLPMVELISQAAILTGVIAVVIILVPPVVLAWLSLFLGLGFFAATMLQRRAKQRGVMAQQYRGAVIRVVHEGLGGVKEVRVLQRCEHFCNRLASTLGKALYLHRMHEVIQRTIPSVIESLGVMGLLGVTVILFIDGTEPQHMVSVLSVFAVAMARMKGSLRSLMTNYSEVRYHSSSLSLVHDHLLELEPQLSGSESSARDRSPAPCEITLRDVSFAYPDSEQLALNDVNIVISHGEAIGFVGPSGSGKSTLVDIIMGIIEPRTGSVVVDGADIQGQLGAWQSRLGYVPQSIFLVDASVRDNIALGLEADEIDEARLQRAVHAAEIDAFVDKLPLGLDTLIGEDGVRLSGGERQRIAVARALYNDPDVLLMDEATSALDNTTEAAVVEAVEALKGQRTVLMIAHRLSTVRRCDRIVFMKNGRVDAVGTYDELEATHAEFKRMTLI